MDIHAQTADSGNIFTQIGDWRKSRATALSNAEVTKLSRIRNDKTNADEAIWVVYLVLLVATVFCCYCGFLTYRDTLSGFSPIAALVFSLLLAGATEACKVFLTGRALRSIFFGWIAADWWAFGLWFFVLSLAAGAFWWSVQISTDGLEMFAKNHSEAAIVRTSLSDHLADATASIDAQIASQQGTQDNSMASKYKGTVVWEAQKTATGAGKNIAALQSQRAAIVTEATAEWKAADGRQTTKVDGWVFWVKKYGGYMELVSFLCLLVIGFFERRLAGMNLPPTPSDEPGKKRSHAPSETSGRGSSESFSAPAPAPHSTVFDLSKRISLFGDWEHGNNGEILFKQTGDLFRQVIQDGEVIGLAYCPSGGQWRNLGKSQVSSELSTYEARAKKPNASANTLEKVNMWRWAAHQFDPAPIAQAA